MSRALGDSRASEAPNRWAGRCGVQSQNVGCIVHCRCGTATSHRLLSRSGPSMSKPGFQAFPQMGTSLQVSAKDALQLRTKLPWHRPDSLAFAVHAQKKRL